MKLLTPHQNNDLKEHQKVRDILRTKEMNEMADKARKDMANAQAEFKKTLARNLDLWAKESEEHSKIVDEMAAEIRELEEKKAKALVPIEIYKKQADEKMEKVLKRESLVKKREEEIEELAERLEEKLDEVGQATQDLKEEARKLSLRREGIQQQEELTIAGVKKLSKQISDFVQMKEKAEQSIYERKTALVLWDRTLQAKDQILKRTDKALHQEAIRIEDQRKTLQAAWDELDRKRNILMEKR